MTLPQPGTSNPTARPTSEAPALLAVNLHRRFPATGGTETDVLRGAELRADAGEIVTITGRSGSGKTTMLALLAGFDTPDEGAVTYHGIPATETPWQVCAVLPQALGLAGELTCAENIALPIRLSPAAPPRDIEATVNGLLDDVGLAELGDRYPDELSFGQQQRVALARALSTDPTVLLVDEPTAHLDHASTRGVLALLRRMADHGSAVVAVTHDPAVRAVADRRFRLDGGVLSPD